MATSPFDEAVIKLPKAGDLRHRGQTSPRTRQGERTASIQAQGQGQARRRTDHHRLDTRPWPSSPPPTPTESTPTCKTLTQKTGQALPGPGSAGGPGALRPGPRPDQRARQDGLHGAEGALTGVAGPTLPRPGDGPLRAVQETTGGLETIRLPRPQRLLAARAPPSTSSPQDARWSSPRLQDDHSRLAVASLVASSETSQAAIDVFDKGVAARGVPQRLRGRQRHRS